MLSNPPTSPGQEELDKCFLQDEIDQNNHDASTGPSTVSPPTDINTQLFPMNVNTQPTSMNSNHSPTNVDIQPPLTNIGTQPQHANVNTQPAPMHITIQPPPANGNSNHEGGVYLRLILYLQFHEFDYCLPCPLPPPPLNDQFHHPGCKPPVINILLYCLAKVCIKRAARSALLRITSSNVNCQQKTF